MAKKTETSISENIEELNNSLLKENEELKKQVALLKEEKEKLEAGIEEEKNKYKELKKEKAEKQTKLAVKEGCILIRLLANCGTTGFEINGKMRQSEEFGNAVLEIKEEDLEKNAGLKKRCEIIAKAGGYISLV